MPPRSRSGEDDASFAVIGERFIVAYRALARSTRRQRLQRELYSVRGHELTPVQVDTLEMLGERTEWRVREVADALGVDRSTASRTLNPLVDLGLATREIDPGDRRNTIVAVTAAGRATATTIAARRRELMRVVLQSFEPRQRVLFTDLLEQFVSALDNVDEVGSAS